MSTFESDRSGTLHRYEINDDALVYSAAGTRVRLEWNELSSIEAGLGDSIYLIPSSRQKLGVWLTSDKMERFLPTLIQAWGKRDRGAAAKASLDYAAETRNVGWLMLVVGLTFPGLLSLLLLVDGFHTLKCNRLLEQGRLAQAQVQKVKKNRRGNFIWTMEFRTAAGEPIKGTRTAYVYDEKGAPQGGQPTVVYSDEDLSCWDVSMRPNEIALNRTQRHFTLLMTMSFGWIFAAVTAGLLLSARARIRRRHPYKEVVRQAGEKL